MKAEIITIGDELLIGQVVNTNQAFLAERLNAVGVFVEWMTTVGDIEIDILDSFRRAFERSDFVCVTGGLGPTHDDITKKAACKFFRTDLVLNEQVLENVRRLLSKRGIPWTDAAKDQAMVPLGSSIFENKVGTAPGMLIEKNSRYFLMMPGVPFEMRWIVEKGLIPFLEKKNLNSVIQHRTLKTTGIGESVLATLIGDVSAVTGTDGTTTLAFLPNPYGTKLRITVREKNRIAAETKLDAAEHIIRSKAEKYIYASDESELEEVIHRIFTERSLTLATAESCTGGMIAHRLTNVSGSSQYFLRGFISYSNQSKVDDLSVDNDLIIRDGAVSRSVAEAMAKGARLRAGSSVGISTTGIAGPTGGTAEKPVGLVWIGYSDSHDTFAIKFNFADDRSRFKERTSQAALELLRRKILKIDLLNR